MTTGEGRLTGSVSVDAGRVVLVLAGEFDAATQHMLRPLFDAAVAAAGAAGMLQVDVSALDGVDEVGLAVLVDLAGHLDRAGARIEVRGADVAFYERLEASHLVAVLNAARPDRSPALVEGLAAVALSGATEELLDAALTLVVTMAHSVIVGAHGVSITLPRQGRFRTVAASNDVVLAMDHDQYDTGQGPCLDAARQGQRFSIDALGAERRWAEFVPRARARGIESIMSSPLLDVTQEPLGALNIYSRTSGAFDIHEKEWAHQFAAQASTVLATAQRQVPSTALIAQLRQALVSRELISQAQGLVMHRDAVGPETAYASLREISRSGSRPLLDVCVGVLASAGRGSTR